MYKHNLFEMNMLLTKRTLLYLFLMLLPPLGIEECNAINIEYDKHTDQFSSRKKIKGHVVDSKGEILIGATVKVKWGARWNHY